MAGQEPYKQESEMDAETHAIVRELKDRQEIYDCIMRYSGGIDRLDRGDRLYRHRRHRRSRHLLRPRRVTDHVFELHYGMRHSHWHHITNHRCEIDGDVAHTSPPLLHCLNREARSNAIQAGVSQPFRNATGAGRLPNASVWSRPATTTGAGGQEINSAYVSATRDKDDPSYMRTDG
ncbi:MAG: hypothetical protein R3E09_00485 [Novosphingobium sp.]